MLRLGGMRSVTKVTALEGVGVRYNSARMEYLVLTSVAFCWMALLCASI